MISTLLSLVFLALFALVPTQAQSGTGSFCAITYARPGNIEYPWSSATLLQVTYGPSSVPNTVNITVGSGTRTYTNKYGDAITSTVAVLPSQDFSDNLLYLNGTVVDGKGLSWSLSPATQFPGHGPNDLRTVVNLYTDSLHNIVEQDAFIVDTASEAFFSNIPGFTNVSFSNPSSPNAAQVDYDACTAPIVNANGKLSRTHPLPPASNQYSYSYYITDGATYQIITNITLTVDGNVYTDQLENQYQLVIDIEGTRDYYFPYNTLLTHSTVSGLNNSVFAAVDQRIYPWALSQARPNVYSMNTAPFLDYDGIEFNVSPSVFKAGTGSGTKYGVVSTYVYGSDSTVAIEESNMRVFPNGNLQQQILTPL